MKTLIKVLVTLVAIVFVVIIGILIVFYSPEKKISKLEKKYFTPTSAYAHLGGTKMHYSDKGTGETIVLIHGSFSSLHTWEAWERELEKNYRVISVDLPGHGLTGPNEEGDYTIDHAAELILRLTDTLGIEKFHIAGNSMGGMVAGMVAEIAPERSMSLNLINAAGYQPSPSKRDSVSVTDARSSNLIFSILRSPFWSKVITRFTPKFLFRTAMKQVYHDDEKISEELVQRYYDLLLREGNRLATIQRMGQLRSKVRWEEIQVPTLILWGRHDTWIPWRHGEGLHSLLPNSTIKIYENAGHVPMEEIPEESVKDYLNFLKRE